jgi:hypothetical protein
MSHLVYKGPKQFKMECVKALSFIVIVIYFTFQRPMIGNKNFVQTTSHNTTYNISCYIKIN